MRRPSAVLCVFMPWLFALSGCVTAPKAAPMADVTVTAVAALSDDVFDVDATLDLARDAMAAGDVSAAFIHYGNILMAETEEPRALRGYGDAALALGQGGAALSAFSQLPQDEAAHISGLVLAEIMTGRSADRELRLNQALEHDPNDPRLWNALGQFFDDAGRPLLAQDNYLRALSTGRASAAAVNNLGLSYLMSGRIDDAKDKFIQARDMDPSRDLYDNNLRLIWAISGDYDAAVAGLSGMRAAHLFNDAGVIARARGKYALAKTLFENALAIAPRHHPQASQNLRALNAAVVLTEFQAIIFH